MTNENENADLKSENEFTNDSSSLSRQSTGPRTSKGKDRSKNNATKHGIFSKVAVLGGEPRAAFDALRNRMFDDRRPQGALEEVLVEKLIISIWRQRRILIVEREISQGDQLPNEINRRAWTRDLLLRYAAAVERDFEKAVLQLERLQRMRLGEQVAAPVKVDVSCDQS